MESLPYDKKDPKSIEAYAKKLEGKSLKELLDFVPGQKANRNKGRFGQTVEELYFRFKPNSKGQPDFPEAGVELKTTPLKQNKSGELLAKERLVLNVINYRKEYAFSWLKSSFWTKNSKLLLIFYIHSLELDVDKVVNVSGLWNYPPEDLEIIKQDWEKIVNKIKAGKAHELSEADTIYLAACVKGAGHGKDMKRQPFSSKLAKQRAFSFKQRYVTQMYKALKEPGGAYELDKVIKKSRDLHEVGSFEGLVLSRFEPFFGKTFEEICALIGISVNKKDKGRFARASRLIMGVRTKEVAEFAKAGITMKTVRIRKNNMPDQDISFPAFKYKEIVKETWDESELRITLSSKFLFVIYRIIGGQEVLAKVGFWQIPEKDLETEVRKTWEKTVSRIIKGNADKLPKSSETRIVHVRTHGQTGKDMDETPQGRMLAKKCFFFNAKYVKEEVVDPLFS